MPRRATISLAAPLGRSSTIIKWNGWWNRGGHIYEVPSSAASFEVLQAKMAQEEMNMESISHVEQVVVHSLGLGGRKR